MKHGYKKIALCSPTLKVGAVEYNYNNIKRCIESSSKDNAEFIVFGEMALTGATLFDMLNYDTILSACTSAIEKLIKLSEQIKSTIIIGAPLLFSNNTLCSCALVIANGNIISIVPKSESLNEEYFMLKDSSKINTDNKEFNNSKLYFLDSNAVISDFDESFGFSIVLGEDFENIEPKSQDLAKRGADIIFNISSAPALISSFENKQNHIKSASKRLNCIYTYVSTGDGESVGTNVYCSDKIVASQGEIIKSSQGNSSEIVYSEVDTQKIRNSRRVKNFGYKSSDIINYKFNDTKADITHKINTLPYVCDRSEYDRILDILSRGIYTRMQRAKCEKVIFGLSGGLDSTMTLVICEKMFKKYNLNPKNILAVTLSSDASSERTKNNAQKILKALKATNIDINISSAVKNHLSDISHTSKTDIVYENAQARERTQILLDLGNKHNALFLGTGDLSEIALGWSTFGGDQVAQYNPNSSITKTLMRAILKNYSISSKNEEVALLINDILQTPISPELLPNQDTEVTIGSYELHDFFLYYLIGNGFSVEKIFYLASIAFKEVSKNEILKTLRIFITRFFNNQFKRTASCDGIQLTEFDLTHTKISSEFESEQFIKDLEILEKANKT